MIQPPGGLFTQSGEEPPEYWMDDLANLRTFIDVFYKQHEKQSGADFPTLLRAHEFSWRVLQSNVGITTPSVFKRASAFTLGFMQESPLTEKMPANFFAEEIQKVSHIDNHQNAVIAFEYARACLFTATYSRGGEQVTLETAIAVSAHFYADLIHSLTTLPKKRSAEPASFHEMALLYESLSYQWNPTCCDPREF